MPPRSARTLAGSLVVAERCARSAVRLRLALAGALTMVASACSLTAPSDADLMGGNNPPPVDGSAGEGGDDGAADEGGFDANADVPCVGSGGFCRNGPCCPGLACSGAGPPSQRTCR